ncbi:ParH-like protein [Streptomyces sp. ACT015]|uniref:ParH-like protein n=1 Tax=Streptomyces sp. ACT015 TaxID=3134807 RepID=UPI003D179CE4
MRSDRRNEMWRRCRRTAGTLALPHPFSAEGFIALLAERRGRPIELIPVASRPDVPCGLLISTDHVDRILYTTDTTPLHRQHILLHEAAHIICEHHAGPAPATAASALMPHLPSALVQRVLGRTVYTEPQEHEAELLATLILARAHQRHPAPGTSPALTHLFNLDPADPSPSADG